MGVMMEIKNAAKTNAQRQAAYRARKATAKLLEVRGIYASAENAAKIKRFAAYLTCA